VIAFGQILPKSLLDLPKYGCVNIHASLLPKYRGAAPIQWAVINGDKETGITTMMMDVEMDTGDMLEKTVVKLNPDETGGSLFDRLSLLGGSLILSTLGKLEKGEITPQPQDHEKATYVKKISKSIGDIDWTMDAVSIERLVRGLNPWPSAFTRWNGRMLKIWEAKVLPDPAVKAPCGSVISAGEEGLKIQTGNGVLCVTSLQLEGKKRMDTAAFLRGYQIEPGCIMERSE
jgi:methionyl-tRNA formyltransferase